MAIKQPREQSISTLNKKTLKFSFVGSSEDIESAFDMAKEIFAYACDPDCMIDAFLTRGVNARLVGTSADEFMFDVTVIES